MCVSRVAHLSWRNGDALGWKPVKWAEVLSQCEFDSHRKMYVLLTHTPKKQIILPDEIFNSYLQYKK